MVTTLAELNNPTPLVPGRNDDPVMSRLNTIASRMETVADSTRDTRDRLEMIENRIEDLSGRYQQAIEQTERSIDEKLQQRLAESIRSAVAPELAGIRSPLDAQVARMAAVETRLERVENIQVESMNALDSRFNDLGFQTRLALSAGGLISLAAMMVVLLR